MNQWKSFETAPKDSGVEFLGWDGYIIDKTWVGWTDDGLDDGNPVYVHADWMSWEPTHWMPLPTPPQDPHE